MQKLYFGILLGMLCALSACSTDTGALESNTGADERHTVLAETEPTSIPDVFASYTPKPSWSPAKRIAALYGPKPQVFSHVPTDTIVEINCSGGTQLRFDPGIFVFAGTQDKVIGNIDIRVTEYLSDADMIIAGLNTTCNKQLLESGGMVYVEASYLGHTLDIRDGEYYSVAFPAEAADPDMELFYGRQDGETLNWIRANENVMDYGDRMYKQKKEAPYTFPGGTLAMYYYLHEQVALPPLREDIPLKATSWVTFMLNSIGEVTKVGTAKNTSTYADAEMRKAFQNMPQWNVGSVAYSGVLKAVTLPVKLEFVRYPETLPLKMQVQDKSSDKRYYAEFNGKSLVMPAAQLGWLNCDKFLGQGKVLANILVEVDSTSDMSVQLVFTDIKSLMTGERYTKGFVFYNVPVDAELAVVCMRPADDQHLALSIEKISGNIGSYKPTQFGTYTMSQALKRLEVLRADDVAMLR